MADKKSIKMLKIKRKRLKSRLTMTYPGQVKLIPSQNISISPEELSHDDDYLENEIEEGRQENSLCQLTKKVIQYIKSKKKLNININELVKDLSVKKRRIYDITNVLQGIGYIEKKGKNEIVWMKNQVLNKKECKIKNNLIKINKQINEINNIINILKDEFVTISRKRDFNKYGYITFNDLKKFSENEKIDFLIIKGNKGTKVEIMDKKNSRKTCEEILRQFQEGQIELNQKNYKKVNIIKNENHIFFDSNNQNSIKIYKINNGEINEIIKDNQKGIYYYINKDINMKKENNVINYNKEYNINYEVNRMENSNVNRIINNGFIQSFERIENKGKFFDDLNKEKNTLNSNKRFSVYDFLKWNKNNVCEEKYNDIKKKYFGISRLFQNSNKK